MPRDQTTKLLAKCGRQHGNSTLDEINASGPFSGVAIQSSVRLDKIRNVGNVYTDVIGSVFIQLDGDSIIQVLRGVRINGEHTLTAQILADFQLPLRNAEDQP